MRVVAGLVVVALVAFALIARPSAQTRGAGRVMSGEIVVKFRPGANASARADAHRAGRGRMRREIARMGVHLVDVADGDEAAAIERYQRNPDVLYAERNFIRTIPTPINHDPASTVIPGDHLFSEQWALHNTGQEFYCFDWIVGDNFCFYQGTPGADIDAPEAWPLALGAGVTVAVIDSGVDFTHPDIAPNYAGGIDFTSPGGAPMDDQGHGTHVAGTIAAAMNNLTGNPGDEEGVVGVAPSARILAYKVCGADGSCDDFAIEQAINQAIVDGAKVINMSFGGSDYSQSLNDAIQDAWNAGVVLVAGAGNDGVTAPFYPAALDHVISVAAFDENGSRAWFSNYGNWVDIAAPGNTIMSTYPMSTCDTSTLPGQTGCYTWLSGTSMATPHVSGAAALVWSRGDVTSNQQVVDILLNSADPVGVDQTARLDSWTIHGGLNVHDALSYGVSNLRPVANAGADRSVTDIDGDGVELVALDGTASSDPDGTIVNYEWREGSTVLSLEASPSIFLSIGTHTLTLQVTDDHGAIGTDTVVITVNSNLPSITIIATTAQATEAGPTSGALTVTRTGDLSALLNVNYTVAGTATSGADFVALPGVVTINPGASSATIPVTPVDDALYESNETVIVTVSSGTGYIIGTPASGTITIVSDDLPSDLVVTSMSAPTIGGADTDIVVTDITKNQGTGSSIATATGFYLSTNTTLDAADPFIGSRQVPVLAPSATDSLQTTVHIPAGQSVGTYYILAKADWDARIQESVETNNTRTSGAIKIGPDLIVSAITVPTTAAAGAPFAVSETTKNQGGGSVTATFTKFYLSKDSTLDGTDTALASRPVPVLTAGASDQGNTALTIPSSTPAGIFFVIAQADATSVAPETTETNNTRVSAAIKVGPDLIVNSVTVPATTAAGASINVIEATKNQGEGLAASSSTGFYLSVNTTVDASDTFLGNRTVGALGPGVIESTTTSLQIPEDQAAGSYYVIARADWNNTVSETIETNNDRVSAAIKIGGDLVISSLTASATGMSNGTITVTETTKNQGGGSVPQSSTGFYLSTSSTFSATATFIGSRTVSALAVSGSESGSTPLVVPAGTTPGTYYVIGVADWNGAIPESLENNNTRTSGTVRIGPDLTVTALSAPTTAVAGATFNATDTTMNQGGEATPASLTRFYLSSNATFDTGDSLIGTRSLASVAAGLSNSGAASLTIPASTAAGIYYIIAKADADDVIAEVVETNNTRTKAISISAAP